jgi:5'-deoxynucleotidase YfbR-like HD superfamily hydrolase
MRYDLIRKGGNVKRFHCHNTIRENTVAAHSWGVATILLHICDPSPNLMRLALYHDVFEHLTGDVPYTSKRDNPEVKTAMDLAEERAAKVMEIDTTWNILPGEEELFKLADMLDFMVFCTEEIEMGNNGIEDLWQNGQRVVISILSKIEKNQAAFDLYLSLKERVYGK